MNKFLAFYAYKPTTVDGETFSHELVETPYPNVFPEHATIVDKNNSVIESAVAVVEVDDHIEIRPFKINK